jgi:hypothetical protein
MTLTEMTDHVGWLLTLFFLSGVSVLVAVRNQEDFLVSLPLLGIGGLTFIYTGGVVVIDIVVFLWTK